MNAVLSIDGVKNFFPEDILDLERLLLFVMEEKRSEGNIIVDVNIDGELYSEEYEHQARDVDLDLVRQIDITTQTRAGFAAKFLEDACIYIEQLEKGIQTAVEFLRAGEEKKGFDILAMSIDGIRTFKSHFENVCHALEKDDMSEKLKELWQRFYKLADRIIEIQESRDSLSLADLLEKEMLPFLDRWKSSLF